MHDVTPSMQHYFIHISRHAPYTLKELCSSSDIYYFKGVFTKKNHGAEELIVFKTCGCDEEWDFTAKLCIYNDNMKCKLIFRIII